MKKTYSLITLILFSTLLISCSVDDVASFSPPSWIIGTWQDRSTSPTISYTFTSDDIIETASGESLKDVYSDDFTEDVKTDSEYKITFKVAGAVYRFVKRTDTTLSYTQAAFGGEQPAVTLTKKN